MHGALTAVGTILGINLFEYVTQGSWSTSVPASGSTHSGAGVVDISGRLGKARLQQVVSTFRRVTSGYGTGWVRDPNGKWPLHAHLLVVVEDTADSAKRQYQAYLRGEDGLSGDGKDNGPRDWVNASAGAANLNLAANANSVPILGNAPQTILGISNPFTAENLQSIGFVLLGLVLIIIALVRLTGVSIGSIGK